MKKIIFIVFITLLMIGCNREIPDPLSNQDIPNIPSAPYNLSVEVADRSLYLSWQMADTSVISGYNIYQAEYISDTLEEEYVLIDSSTVTEYTDFNLQNGLLYYYRVSALNQDGLEGYPSQRAGGTPNLYSVIVNDGAETTNLRTVNLTLVGPSTTTMMQISNSSDFGTSSWEPFRSSKQWTLSEGTGLKTVYTRFRDSDGNSTYSYIQDDITYEILTYQYSIEINNNSDCAYSRSVNLIINAPSGTSSMMISNVSDYNGAEWESYSRNKSWFISPETVVNRDTVSFYVIFHDENNDSVEVEAVNSIVLASSDPVDLLSVYQEPDYYQTIELEWSRSLSEDFYVYRLFRSFNSNSVDTIISSFDNITQTDYTDEINITDLPSGTADSAFYMVRFYSVYDDSSDSDTILVILENLQPPAVTAFIGDVSFDSNDTGGFDLHAILGWSRSGIHDFSHYIVYENTVLDTVTASPVDYSYSIDDLTYSITKGIDSLNADYSFYYWLKVFDLGGLASEYSLPDSITD